MKNTLLLHLFTFVSFLSFSQNNSVYQAQEDADYEIKFKSGKFTPEATIDFALPLKRSSIEQGQEHVFRLIQFYSIPSDLEKKTLSKSGIELLHYIPNKAFLAKLDVDISTSDWKKFNIRSVLTLENKFKLSEDLIQNQYPIWALTGDEIKLIVKFYTQESRSELVQAIIAKDGQILKEMGTINTLVIQCSKDNIQELASNPLVQWIEPISAPSTPDGTRGQSSVRSNTIKTNNPSGRKYDGTGVVTAIVDDGIVGPHIDFTGRITQHTEKDDRNHGDGVAGILVGSGNLDPTKEGMASGASINIYGVGFINVVGGYPHIENGVEHLENLGTVITSTSYSQDDQVYKNQVLLHVFSAGNSGTRDHGYGAGSLWGNISGGAKAAKNIICAGNVNYKDELSRSSSRGPAADGRIKPDLCAMGDFHETTNANNTYNNSFGGTSASSPAIAGVSAQLYQAYKEFNNGDNPESGLIKAAMLNTARDMGNPGPDFEYGWGVLNGLKAVRIIEDERYVRDNISQGGSKSHTITVPENVSEVRVMTYWTDVVGDPMSAIGLVNDIDMELVTPSNQSFTPWVLDPTPNEASLSAPAVRGVDHLNNVEQVTIENPSAGTYTVNLSGFAIPEGPQTYYVLYEFIYDEVELVYPIGGEGFVPGETEVIYWDASDKNESFSLEYSTDGGNSYTTIASNVSSGDRYYDWRVPSTVSNNVKVRVNRGNSSSESEFPFTIVELPEDISVTTVCANSIGLEWDAVNGATSYEVSVLGEKYMDSVGTSTTNNIVITGLDPEVEHWYSVKAIVSGGKGRRAVAIYHSGGIENCTDPCLNSYHDGLEIIEAETFCDMFGVENEESSENGLNVAFIENDDWVKYSNVDFGINTVNTIDVRVSSKTMGGTLEVWIDDKDSGDPHAVLTVASTGDWQVWETIRATFDDLSGSHDVYLVFKGSGFLFNVNWFRFSDDDITALEDNDFDLKNQVEIFPNPTSDVLNINNTSNGTAEFKIISLTGNLIYSSIINQGVTQINLNEVGKGSYMVQVETNERLESTILIRY